MPTPLPRRGDFGAQVLTGFFDPVVADGAHTESYFGLSLEGSWPYAVAWTDDGAVYAFHRNVQGRTTRGIVAQRCDPAGDGLHVFPEGFALTSGGVVRRSIEGEHDVFAGAQYPGGPSFDFRLGPTVAWTERLAGGDVALDLAGSRLSPGFHVYTPWRGGGLYYTSLGWAVDGTVFGRPARGFAFYDQSYLAHGDYWNESRVWNELQVVWGVFATTYTNGDTEFGHFSAGAGDFRFVAVAGGDGPTTVVRDGIDVDVKFAGDGFAEAVRVDARGEEWLFTTRPGGAMVDASKARPGWRGHVGVAERAGETRTVDRTIAWCEIFPERL